MYRLPTYLCVGSGQNVVQACKTQYEVWNLGGEACSTKETGREESSAASQDFGDRERERECVFSLFWRRGRL